MAKFYTPTKLSENIRETPEGYLFCLGVPIARTGWQEYADGESPLEVGEDGVVRVYRDPKEVFRPETIASFQGKSITIRHPNDFVGPGNWQSLTRGVLQNVRKAAKADDDGEQSLLADLLITESMAIQLVKNGLREVSCGYEAEYEQTGEGEGKQFNIIGNHCALVEEGRAGPAYAINDHKGKVSMEKGLIEKLKARFGAKVIDEAMAEEKKEEKTGDAGAYDELVKMVKDLGAKIEGMSKGKDEEKPAPKKEEPKKEEKPAKDEDAEDAEKEEGEKSEDDDGEEMKIEERIKALETAVAKLLESKTGDEDAEEGEESEDEEGEESEDEESEEAEDEEKESSMTGDTAARVEILAPGLKPAKKNEDAKQRALVAAFATKEGREVIETITGSKKLVLDSAEKINSLFIAASEVIKAKRGTGLEKTKDAKSFHTDDNTGSGSMTAEKMNELNAAHWARK